jgi:MFS family permease
MGSPTASPPTKPAAGPWYRELSRYHWFVLVVAALGWLFDTMDQQLFSLARMPAMKELLDPSQPVAEYGGYATAIFLIGWAVGGVAFGILGDRLGRAKTMVLTILVYSLFTGLSALSQDFVQFAVFRFLTGLGVGGEFAVGVALVAEAMPERARTPALGWLQSLSAVGNITAALVNNALITLQYHGALGLSDEIRAWRIMFVVGAAPAVLAVLVMRKLREPERWQAVAVGDELHRRLGSLRELFGDPRWRRHAFVGLALAFAGVVGLWGIGFFSYDLLRLTFKPVFEARELDPAASEFKLTLYVGWASMLQNLGGFVGIQGYLWLTQRTTRRFAFLVSFVSAAVSTAFTFFFLGKVAGVWDVVWMVPLMGACQLAMFGGYAIYFPELFPTRLRSTGTSFCYNVGRLVAAAGPFTLGLLTSRVFAGYAEPMRYAGVVMCVVFLIGIAALPFAPETKGRPLPE